jgi:L-cysteine/cystine lyase
MIDKLTRIRAQLPAVQGQAFLNTGWYGPLPTVAQDAINAAALEEYRYGRPTRRNIESIVANKDNLRKAFASLLNVQPEHLALTHHTTDGMNIATMGFNWQPGDEVATTSIEHEAGVFPLYTAALRYGIKINFAEVGYGEEPLDAIDAALTPKTRLLSISHGSYSTGARFPIKEIVEMAHAKGIPVIVDGAQSAGAFALDLTDLDVDYYAIPGQKWLCGPEGVGAFYVRPDRLSELNPTYTNFRAIKNHDWHGTFEFVDNAVMYDTGTIYPSVLAGMLASLNWFTEEVGPDWAYDRIAHIAAYTRKALGELDGVRITTPPNRQGSLVNFLPVGWSPAQMAGMVSAVEACGYVIRNISHEPYAVRVSCGFYNTEAEIDGLRNALADILAAGPQSVAIPQWAVDNNLSNEPVF